MFAIIETGGTQYKVEKGQKLDINRVEEKEGSTITFDDVLLLNDEKDTKVGAPFVEGASVTGKILAHKRGDKIVVFKMKPKKRYQKKQGHRQELTTVEITDIKASGAKKTAPKKTASEPAAEKTTAKEKTPKQTATKTATTKKSATKKVPAKKKAPAEDQKAEKK